MSEALVLAALIAGAVLLAAGAFWVRRGHRVAGVVALVASVVVWAWLIGLWIPDGTAT